MFISTILITVLLSCIDCSYGTEIETHPNVNLLPKSCGDIDGKRVSEARAAQLYEFPWMALISYVTRFGHGFKCSGTIINSKYILTAAHCVNNKYNITGVRIGEFDLRYKTDCQGEEPHVVCESHIQDIGVENIIPHQNHSLYTTEYTTSTIANDIALIRLSTPIDFKYKNALPIRLPVTQELRNAPLAGKTGIVAGWFLTDDNTDFTVLLKKTVSIKTDNECKSFMYYNKTTDGTERVLKEICADETQKDVCRGYGGSPLMLEDIYQVVDRYIQYGIVSRGPLQCGSLPEVYTDVTKYMGWILDNIKE